ncbi:DUF6207 family protein [Streptomyces sp. NBC_00280]|uniref:DUF6207 family protein n=1 Tax=Streptomyces sp. NBC_00280 TaxID=2975699 RepID=UPI0032527B11
MGPTNEVHVGRPATAVVEIAACDDQTAFAVQKLLAARWATSTATHTTRDPGQPGVRLLCYLDVRQEPVPDRDGLWRIAPWHMTEGSGLRTLDYDLLPSRQRIHWVSRTRGIQLPASDGA